MLLVQPAPDLLGSLRSYRSASELIRETIASPTTENENRAWDAVLPTVDMLRDFYEYASELGKIKLINHFYFVNKQLFNRGEHTTITGCPLPR